MDEPQTQAPAKSLTLVDLLYFYTGQERGIEAVASNPQSVWVGLVFVLLAGLAREYDAEYLLAEPYHLFIPLLASVVSASALFFVLSSVAHRRRWQGFGWATNLRMFLSCFWMTAPMALAYGIPYEAFLPAETAGLINLNTLQVVAVWRVVLMVRVAQVMFAMPLKWALPLVLFMADTVAVLAMMAMPGPVIVIMGGIRMNAAERAIAQTRMFVMFFGTLLWPILCSIWLTGLALKSEKYGTWTSPSWKVDEGKVSWTFWLFAVLVLASLLSVTPHFQRQQRLRYEFMRGLKDNRHEHSAKLLLAHKSDEFPRHWESWTAISRLPEAHYRDNIHVHAKLLKALLEAPQSERQASLLKAHSSEFLHKLFWHRGFSEDDFKSQGAHPNASVKWLDVWTRLPGGAREYARYASDSEPLRAKVRERLDSTRAQAFFAEVDRLLAKSRKE